MAISCAVSSALQSEEPLPYTRPSETVAANGGNFHLLSSSTGTTSVWDMNMRPASPEEPSSLAIRLPRPGTRSRISLSMQSSASQSRANSHTGVSLPVGMRPELTEGIRTRACSNSTISSRAESV